MLQFSCKSDYLLFDINTYSYCLASLETRKISFQLIVALIIWPDDAFIGHEESTMLLSLSVHKFKVVLCHNLFIAYSKSHPSGYVHDNKFYWVFLFWIRFGYNYCQFVVILYGLYGQIDNLEILVNILFNETHFSLLCDYFLRLLLQRIIIALLNLFLFFINWLFPLLHFLFW